VLAGCDAGGQKNQPQDLGAPVHFVANVGLGVPQAPDASSNSGGTGTPVTVDTATGVVTPIQLTFDRLLMPACITRQTFLLEDVNGNELDPAIAYDPVSRVVTITPVPGSMTAGQPYTVTALPLQPGVSYTQPVDTVIGVMAIDGATLDPAAPLTVAFQAVPGDAGAAAVPSSVLAADYCTQVNKMFLSYCGASGCHGSPPALEPAQGLVLTTAAGIQATAVGQVAVGANTGPRPAAQSPNVLFGLDMPIIDPGNGNGTGNPGNSWLMYKILMAVPLPLGDAGAIVPLSDTERATLASLVSGREMPYPSNPVTMPEPSTSPLTLANMETISQWVALGAIEPCQ
jgi:hypothetical protein